mmetsp:Transcript_95014/g.255567  ORF Transcript_95014/g.255567 Transcript_95014/m.255567 type:complete len:207 (+) Transcript_95014:213-833(+)
MPDACARGASSHRGYPCLARQRQDSLRDGREGAFSEVCVRLLLEYRRPDLGWPRGCCAKGGAGPRALQLALRLLLDPRRCEVGRPGLDRDSRGGVFCLICPRSVRRGSKCSASFLGCRCVCGRTADRSTWVALGYQDLMMLFLLLLLWHCIRLLVLRSSGQADVKSPVSLLHRFRDLKSKLRAPSQDSAALQHAGAQAQYASWPPG